VPIVQVLDVLQMVGPALELYPIALLKLLVMLSMLTVLDVLVSLVVLTVPLVLEQALPLVLALPHAPMVSQLPPVLNVVLPLPTAPLVLSILVVGVTMEPLYPLRALLPALLPQLPFPRAPVPCVPP